jgi:hypothetical protein
MSEQKFTPGPWQRVGAMIWSPSEHATIAAVSELRDSTFVEYKSLRLGSADFDEAMANARLIAAAPKWYAALKQLAETDLHEGNCASLAIASKRIRNIARAVLANVEA